MLFTEDYLEKAEFFLKKLRRQDVWSAAEYFPALKVVKEEVDYYTEHHYLKDFDESLQKKILAGEDVDKKEYSVDVFEEGQYSLRDTYAMQSVEILWEKFNTLSGIFEEDSKEWYLPTYYYCMVKE